MVRVLAEDPALGTHLSSQTLPVATAQAIAPVIAAGPGALRYLVSEETTHGHLGLLVLAGLLARHIRLGELGATEFVGPGDVIRPWVRPGNGPHSVETRWEVLAPARLADLNREFAVRIRPWPELVAALLDREAGRIESHLLQSAFRQAVRVEDRVLLAMWQFAERWGEETPEGRTINLPKLTGEVLASIVGARRQSVSTALGQLADRGAVRRRSDGTWLLSALPSQLERIEIGKRASDHSARFYGERTSEAGARLRH
jgi:CRP-like cAMP-binding protein